MKFATLFIFVLSLFALPALAQSNSYTVKTIIDNTQDPFLLNPWGLSRPVKSSARENEWWVSDNNTGFSTLYYANKSGPPSLAGLVISIPSASGTGIGSPTGTAFNGATGPGPKRNNFAFSTLDGTISNWNAGSKPAQPGEGCSGCHVTTATIKVNRSAAGASYQGLAIATSAVTNAPAYYAANANGGVEVFDAASFAPVSLPPGAFTNPSVPADYTPAGIQTIGSRIYVAYNATAGGGTGYVDAFDSNGTLQFSLQQGAFNQPWGIALAPTNFGALSNLLLVGNTGSGMIGAYSPKTGQFVDFVRDAGGQPVVLPGLWGIGFGNGHEDSGPKNVLYFAAGGADLTTGVFGSIAAN